MKKYNNLGLLVKMAKQQQQLKKDILKYINTEKQKSALMIYHFPSREIICYKNQKNSKI